MSMEDKQKIYVHVVEYNDGPDVSLSTRGETPPSAHAEIKEKILNMGVSVDDMGDEVDKNIGEVVFNGEDVEEVTLYDWVTEEYSY